MSDRERENLEGLEEKTSSFEYRQALATNLDQDIWLQKYTPRELWEKQLRDEDIAPILKWKENDEWPFGPIVWASSPGTQNYWLLWHTLFLKEGVRGMELGLIIS